MVAVHPVVDLEMADHRLDRRAAPERALDRVAQPALLAGHVHPEAPLRRGLVALVAGIGDPLPQLGEALFQERPIDRPAEPHQAVPEVEHLLEPGTEQVLLPCLPALPWSHRPPRRNPDQASESCPKTSINLPENLSTTRANRQLPRPAWPRNSLPINGLVILHGRRECPPLRPSPPVEASA